MIKITSIEQRENLKLDENKLFYIYGKIGSGKTHLAKVIANNNGKKVFYTDFYEMINSVTQGKELEIEDEEVIIIDDEIKPVIKKEFTCFALGVILEELKNAGKTLFIVGNLTPEELKQKNEDLANVILSGEQIEVSYDIETRKKIVKEYSKQYEIEKIRSETINNIAKEENLGKIRGKINQLKIAYRY